MGKIAADEQLSGVFVRSIGCSWKSRLAQKARSSGDEEQAQKFEQQIKTARAYLNQHDPKLSPEQEKIRKKLNKGLTDAYRRLDSGKLIELADHLRKQITYKTGTYQYAGNPAEWSFDPPTA